MAVIAVAAAALLAVGVLVQPVSQGGEIRLTLFGLTIPTTCWFKLTTGIPCAGCGLTRSIVLLLHGRPADAFAVHPFGPWILLLGILAIPPRLVRDRAARSPWTPWWDRTWLVLAGATVVAMLVWWVHHVGLLNLLSAWRG